MKWTQVGTVVRQIQWALAKAAHGVNGVNDLQKRQLVGLPSERESAIRAAAGHSRSRLG